jgi:hypothetical protein
MYHEKLSIRNGETNILARGPSERAEEKTECNTMRPKSIPSQIQEKVDSNRAQPVPSQEEEVGQYLPIQQASTFC